MKFASIRMVILLMSLHALSAHAGLVNWLKGDPPPPEGVKKVFNLPEKYQIKCGGYFLDDKTILCPDFQSRLGIGKENIETMVEWRIEDGLLIIYPDILGRIKCVDPRSKYIQIYQLGNDNNAFIMGYWGQPLTKYNAYRKVPNDIWLSQEFGYINPYSCQFHADYDKHGMEYLPGMWGTLLYEEDGIISGGKWGTGEKSNELWRKVKPEYFNNPVYAKFKVIYTDETFQARLQAIPMHWNNKYYFYSPQLVTKDGVKPGSRYIFDGHVATKMPTPNFPSNVDARSMPMKTGILWAVSGGFFTRDRRPLGIYLESYDHPGVVKKISDAETRLMGVSPNGCRVQMGLQWPGTRETSNFKTQIFDFCDGDEK